MNLVDFSKVPSERTIARRRTLGHGYFKPGYLYITCREYSAWIKNGTPIDIPSNVAILCVQKVIKPSKSTYYEFLYNDKIICWTTGEWTAVQYLNIVENEETE